MWPCLCVSLPLCTDYIWSSACLIRCVTWNVLPLSTMASEAFRVCCKRDWLETNLDCNKALQFIETHQSHRSDQSGKWVGERDTQGTSPGFLSVMTAELGVGLKVEMCKGTEVTSGYDWISDLYLSHTTYWSFLAYFLLLVVNKLLEQIRTNFQVNRIKTTSFQKESFPITGRKV